MVGYDCSGGGGGGVAMLMVVVAVVVVRCGVVCDGSGVVWYVMVCGGGSGCDVVW